MWVWWLYRYSQNKISINAGLISCLFPVSLIPKGGHVVAKAIKKVRKTYPKGTTLDCWR